MGSGLSAAQSDGEMALPLMFGGLAACVGNVRYWHQADMFQAQQRMSALDGKADILSQCSHATGALLDFGQSIDGTARGRAAMFLQPTLAK